MTSVRVNGQRPASHPGFSTVSSKGDDKVTFQPLLIYMIPFISSRPNTALGACCQGCSGPQIKNNVKHCLCALAQPAGTSVRVAALQSRIALMDRWQYWWETASSRVCVVAPWASVCQWTSRTRSDTYPYTYLTDPWLLPGCLAGVGWGWGAGVNWIQYNYSECFVVSDTLCPSLSPSSPQHRSPTGLAIRELGTRRTLGSSRKKPIFMQRRRLWLQRMPWPQPSRTTRPTPPPRQTLVRTHACWGSLQWAQQGWAAPWQRCLESGFGTAGRGDWAAAPTTGLPRSHCWQHLRFCQYFKCSLSPWK